MTAILMALEDPQDVLFNGGFDQGFLQHEGQSSVVVAEGWAPFYALPGAEDDAWKNRKPEWKPAAPYANRIKEGPNAQQFFVMFGTNECAGVCQRVHLPGWAVGKPVELTAWGQVWSTHDDEPRSGSEENGVENGGCTLQIGIDPFGGTDPDAPEIVWSEAKESYDVWTQIVVQAAVTGEWVTVFLAGHSRFPVKHNDFYYDAASLTIIGSPAPAPASGLAQELILMGQRLIDIGKEMAEIDQVVEALADRL